MSATYDSLINHLDNEGLKYRSDELNEVIMMTLPCKLRECDFLFHVESDGKMLDVMVRTGYSVEEGARPLVLETLMRANCSLRMGALVMDLSDGQIVLRANQLIEDELTRDRLFLQISALLTYWDKYGPAVMSVWLANTAPADAIWAAEAA